MIHTVHGQGVRTKSRPSVATIAHDGSTSNRLSQWEKKHDFSRATTDIFQERTYLR